ncbi:MAG: hypothetical protein K2N06_02245 [Oscillospiraceae bacterium]|nr:hypothetical protein [Oscillospiraceae bacterium]
MYCEDLGFSIPNETILEIKFLKYDDFRSMVFNDKKYTIIGGDDVDNLIGVDVDGKVWFLDTVDEFETYISKGLKTFVNQLELYRDWNHPPLDDSDEVNDENARQFALEIASLDKDALLYEENFWSVVIEQMEDGLL